MPAAAVPAGKWRVRVVLRAANGAIVGKDISDANFRVGIADVLTGVNGSGSWSTTVLP